MEKILLNNPVMKTKTVLDAWKLPMSLVSHMHMLSADFANEAIDGLTSEIRETTFSTPLNVAAGAAKGRNDEFTHFHNISLGSMAEIEAQIIFNEALGFISSDKINDAIKELMKIRLLSFELNA